MQNTSTYFRRVVTQSWCAFIFEQGRGVYHKINCCRWVVSGFLPSGHLTRTWQLLWQTKVTLQGRTFLVFVCFQCWKLNKHITATRNVCHSPTEECTIFPHQKKILVLKESTKSKHFKSPELAFSALTIITKSLIIWTGRSIWVESKSTVQDRRWTHKQWVRLVTEDAWVQFALPTQSCWTLSLGLCLFSNREMWLQDSRHTSASFPPANYGIGCKYLPAKAIQTFQ